MDIKQIKELNERIYKMERSEQALTGMYDSFGNHDVRKILMMISQMEREDIVRMFTNHHMAEVDFYRGEIKRCGVNVDIEV